MSTRNFSPKRTENTNAKDLGASRYCSLYKRTTSITSSLVKTYISTDGIRFQKWRQGSIPSLGIRKRNIAQSGLSNQLPASHPNATRYWIESTDVTIEYSNTSDRATFPAVLPTAIGVNKRCGASRILHMLSDAYLIYRLVVSNPSKTENLFASHGPEIFHWYVLAMGT